MLFWFIIYIILSIARFVFDYCCQIRLTAEKFFVKLTVENVVRDMQEKECRSKNRS